MLQALEQANLRGEAGPARRYGGHDVGLPERLRDLYVARRTGLLHFTRQGVEKASAVPGDLVGPFRHPGAGERLSLRFVNGQIVSAVSSLPRWRLGETMVRHGLLARADLERTLTVVEGEGRRLGVVLREMGMIDKGRLEEAVGIHVGETLARALSWEDAAHAFEEEDVVASPAEDLSLKLSTGELILQAVRRVRNLEAIRKGLGNLDRVLTLTSDPLLRFQRLTLDPAEGFLLSRVDGVLTARAVMEITPVDPAEAERSLFGLLCTGFIEYLPAKPKRRAALEAERRVIDAAFEGLATRSHFEILGVSAAASDEEIKAAYVRLAKCFHPDALLDPALADLRSRREAVFMSVCAAYRELGLPGKRARSLASLATGAPVSRPVSGRGAPGPEVAPRPPEGVSHAGPAVEDAGRAPRPRAEAYGSLEALRMAEEQLAEGRHSEATASLERTLPVLDGRARRSARLLLARAHLKVPGGARKAEEELQRVVLEEPSNFEAHLLLGTIYRDLGLRSRAVTMFRKALSLKPRHKAALAELRSLQPPEPARPGLIGRLRGRVGQAVAEAPRAGQAR